MSGIFRYLPAIMALIMLGLFSGPALALICMDEDCNWGHAATPSPPIYRLAIADLVRLDEKPGFDESALSKRLADNFNYTGGFEIIDKRAFLEGDYSAGLDGESEPDYAAWGGNGTDFLIMGSISESAPRLVLDMRLYDVGQKRQILAKRYTGAVKDARKMINQFSNDAIEAMTGEPGVFGSQIIFVAGDLSRKSIMMTEFGSDEVVQIAGHKGGPSTQPTMGPDGRKAWVHRNGNKWELLVDGEVIASGRPHLSPAFKPDGTVAAAYSEERRTAIYTFSDKGKETLLTGKENGNITVSPTFSPDGSQMAFVSNQDNIIAVYVSTAEGGPAIKLTNTSKATDPAWSPTGEYIAFVTRETDICIIHPDGSGLRQLTGGQGRNYRPSFSPDGRLIVFSSDRNGKMQLFVMPANGGHRARLLLPDFKEPQDLPYWSPNRLKGD